MEVVGTDTINFGYTHFGGNNNLLPGRHEQQSHQLSPPDGTTHIFPAIAKVNVGFINGNEAIRHWASTTSRSASSAPMPGFRAIRWSAGCDSPTTT